MAKQGVSQEGQLSPRLREVAGFVPNGARLADIGGDHALLPIHLVKQGKIKQAVVGEINRGPCENARERVAEAGLESMIEVRLGDGLSVIHPGETDAVVIAGMGGTLIARILEEGKEKLTGVRRLVLQPNIGSGRVRDWLRKNGFRITDESIVEDAGILYEVIAAEPGDADEPYRGADLSPELLQQAGPVLWRKRHPLLLRRLNQELEAKKRIVDQLRQGRTAEAEKRRTEIKRELQEWEKVIACLSGERN
jgi:tRNA (adenine22-N1)-methyltransferase